MKQDAAEMVNAYPNWTQSFSKAALQRGERYAEEGRVELEGFYGPTITANCQGSGDNHYRQSIELHVAGGRCHVHGECDCPVGQNCKHCAAALFCISDPWSNHEATQADPATLSAELQHWLSGLEQAPPKTDATEDKRGRMVCYQLQLTDDAGCALLVRKGTRTEDGIRFSRVQSLYDFLYEPPRFVTDEDIRILRLLSALNQGGGQDRGYRLKGQEGGELFQRALETGRMFFDTDLPLLHEGPVRHAEFRWVRLDNGNYRGRWYSGEAMLRCVIPLLPLYYLDLPTREVGKVEHSLDPHVAVQLTIAPDVPEHLVVPLSHKLNALSHKVPTPTQVQEQLLDNIQPKPLLALGSLEYTAYMPKTGRMQRQMQHRAALAFDYDGLQASGTDEKPLTRLAGSTSQRIRRQPQAELALRNALRDLGFKPATRQSKALPDSAGEMYQLPDDEAWLRFAREGLPRLRDCLRSILWAAIFRLRSEICCGR